MFMMRVRSKSIKNMYQKNRVVITGIGLVSPVGNNVADNWQSIINGKSGIVSLDDFDLNLYRSNVAGIVSGEKEGLDKVFPKQKQRKTSRFIQLAVLASFEAMKDAGLGRETPIDRERFGTYVGVGVGGLGVISEGASLLQKSGPKHLSPFLIPKAIISEVPAWVSMEWNLQGPMLGVCNACASGADSIGLAFRAIQFGSADYMLVGGTESSITPLALATFGNMRVLSSWRGDPAEASRPFAKDRCGFVIAEGAGILILERKDLAEKRGANIYAEIVGYGAVSDSYHITAMHPEGRGAVLAIRQALKEGGISPEQVGYVNAHGTATPMNDPIEVHVLKKVFGPAVDPTNPKRVFVSSTKSMTGHLLGAAGAVEVAFSALALKNQIVPPTINLHHNDEICNLDFVPNQPREKKIEYAISNSFGFGGGNAVIALSKYRS